MEKERREIASLTKIMTAYTAIGIITRLDINILASKVEASIDAALMAGTSAELAEGDVLSIWDMLHAMLLPSGNDAAFALAEYFGLLLLEIGLPSITKSTDPIAVFVSEMNTNAKILGMHNTTFANPHGLQNSQNKSTAHDIAKLAATCMKMPLFSEIVKKHKYSCIGQDMFGNQKSLCGLIQTNCYPKDLMA
jgi:D-alanyl-D-alanine carboxypeptidase